MDQPHRFESALPEDSLAFRLFTGINTGAAHSSGDIPLSSLLSSLGIALGVFLIQVFAFCLLRKRIPAIYEPRSFLVSRFSRVAPAPLSFFGWLYPVYNAALNDIAQSSGLDAYFFLRYILFLLGVFCLLGVVVGLVLIPVNATSNVLVHGLDMISWSNTAMNAPNRLFLHCIIALGAIACLCFYIYRELQLFVSVRHDYLSTTSSSVLTNTILVEHIPIDYTFEARIRELFENYPGGLKNVWMNRNYKHLAKLVEKRRRISRKLEHAELKMIRKALKSSADKNADEKQAESCASSGPTIMENYVAGFAWKQFISLEELPRHHILPSWKNWGKCISTEALTFFKNELERISVEVKNYQAESEILCPVVDSCLIEFNNPVAVQIACTEGSKIFRSGKPNLTAVSVIQVNNTKGILWDNISRGAWNRFFNHSCANLAILLVILGWSVPVAFIGIISQPQYLVQLIPPFDWVHKASPALCEIVSGIGPPIALQLLFSCVPRIFQLLAFWKRYSVNTMEQLDVQRNLFIFFHIQIFLVLTLSTGITRILYQAVRYPTSIPGILAEDFPKSVNFFISYVVLQGLAISGNELLRLDRLASYLITHWIFDYTGREIHEKNMRNLHSIDYAPAFSALANLAGITLAYSIVSPIIVICSALSFFLLYFSYKYQIMYRNVTGVESYGLFYPQALLQLFAGVYCLEICMVGLYLGSYEENSSKICAASAILMIIAFVCTVLFHYRLESAFSPYLKTLNFNIDSTSFDKTRTANLQCSDTPYRSFSNSKSEKGPSDTESDSTAPEPVVLDTHRHPAVAVQKPCVWIPDDTLGIGQDQVNEMKNQYPNIRASTVGYTLTADTHSVSISRPPPEEYETNSN